MQNFRNHKSGICSQKKSTVAFLHYKMYKNLLLYSAIINHINAKMARSHQLWYLGFAVLCLPASVVHLSLLRSVSLWDNSSQWPSLCDLSKYFSDEFMGLFASLRSYLTKPEAHFLNYRQNQKEEQTGTCSSAHANHKSLPNECVVLQSDPSLIQHIQFPNTKMAMLKTRGFITGHY